MAIIPTEYIQGDPIIPPIASLPPIEVSFEVPEGASSPPDEKLRRLAIIRADFPQLWEAAMAGLQRHFDEQDDGRRVPEAVLSAGILMLLFDESETDEDFYWSLGLEIRDRQPWQGWEADFHGRRFVRIMFYP